MLRDCYQALLIALVVGGFLLAHELDFEQQVEVKQITDRGAVVE